MAQLNFDARSVVPDTGQQDPVPAGWYNVVIDKSEMKPTKDGTGMRLELQFKIIDGQFANRKIFEGLNLQNSSPMAQEIAYKQLSAIAHAVKVLMVQDSSQLHNIPLKVKVKLKPASGQYDAGNSIVSYKDINEVVTQPVAAGAPAPFGGAPAAFGAAPAAFAPPAAPAAFAPPAQQWAPPAQPAQPAQPAAPAAPAAWAPPATQQPWAPPAQAPVQAPTQAPAPTMAPVQPQAPAAGLAPPAWATAQPPAQAQAPAPVAAAPAPATSPMAGVVPPWQQAPAQ